MKYLRSLLPWLCFGLPFLLIFWLQRAYAFRNLTWDDWALVQDRFPGKDMTPNWGDLFAPYSGHSIPWLRLSVIPAIRMVGGDARFVLVLCVLLALGSALMLRKLAVASLGRATWVTSLIIGLTVASPVLAQVWQWWICWPIFLPFFCLLLGVTILRRAEFGWGRFAVVLGLAWIASQAQAAGAMVWLALVPSLRAFCQAAPRRTRITAAVVLLAVGACILKPFFMDSVSNGDETSMLARLPKIASYGMVLLGGPIAQGWSPDSVVPCQIAGALLGLGMLWVVMLVVRRLPLNPDLAGWCSVASFGFFSAVAIAFGRYWLPVYQALVGRYLLLSYPLWLGLYFALRTWNQQRSIAGSGTAQPMSRGWIAATTAILLSQINAWGMGVREIKLGHANHLSGRSRAEFHQAVPRSPGLEGVLP